MRELMMLTLNLSIVEVIFLFFCAVVLGIVIHFFFISRKNLKVSSVEIDRTKQTLDDWKLKYFNDMEAKDNDLGNLNARVAEAEENVRIYTIELDEMRKQNKKLLYELEANKRITETATTEKQPDYIDQLREARRSLMEHNEKINLLLEQIDVVKEKEEKEKEILQEKEELSNQVEDLRHMLHEKEKEVSSIRQKEHLTKEMTSMLDSAYSEFGLLQSKMQKLEMQVANSKMVSMEYEDLKEAHLRMSKEFEEQKNKLQVLNNDNQHLRAELEETESHFREAEFQRQQLQKKVAYLEELNDDLQQMSEANKKLEGQIKRIGELESMLNMVSEERDALIRKQVSGL